jgi:hemolysin activation/secretion protein
MSKRSQWFCLTYALAALFSLQAHAQTLPTTGAADAGRASEQFRPDIQIPGIEASTTSISAAPLLDAPEGSDEVYFTFGGLDIEGNKIYSDGELATLYQDKVGKDISVADLYAIANEISMQYRRDGFLLTQVFIPPQTIESGMPRVKVSEGIIGNIKIEVDDASDNLALAQIRGYAAKIKSESGAANIKYIERQLLLLNDLPGIKARSVLLPSKKEVGKTDIHILVDRKPYDAEIAIDNHGSRYLGPWTATANASVNSALGLNEKITVQTAFAPGGGYELLHGGISYHQNINAHGTKAGISLSRTKTDPGYTLSRFDVRGSADLYSLYVTHPFIRSREQNLYAGLNFDWRDVISKNNIDSKREDNIRALRASATYDFQDRLLTSSASVIQLRLSKGLDVFGASEKGDKDMSRPRSNPEFTKIDAAFSRLQSITGNVNLQLRGQAQLASNAVPSSEEFGVGGISNGRGYDPSEILGDHGVAGQVELQWNTPVPIPEAPLLTGYQLYSFMDAGRVWNEDNTNRADKRNSVVSTGVGVNLYLKHDINVGLGVAVPLTRRVESKDGHDPRFYFNMSKQF